MGNFKFLVGVVCYNPKIEKLNNIIDVFGFECVVIYNNGGVDENWALSRKIKVLGGEGNKGLGASCNAILQYAKSSGVEYLVLSDQDTMYPESYIENMTTCIKKLKSVVALLPAWLDVHSRDMSPVPQYIYSGFFLSLDRSQNRVKEISHGIMSGMMINMSLYKSDMEMNDSLFIDWVDTEWCWRMKQAYSLKIYYNPAVCLAHELGLKRDRLFGRSFTSRAPLRDYYIIRNAAHLFLRGGFSLIYRAHLVLKVLHHIFMLFVSYKRRFIAFRVSMLALSDAFKGRVGKIEAHHEENLIGQ